MISLKNCHLHTLILLKDLVQLQNTKEDILKNIGNQTVDGSDRLHSIFFSKIDVNGYRQLYGYQQASEYLVFKTM